MDEVREKIYCMPYNGGGNDALATAALMQDKNSPAEMAALMGGMGNQWNNPFVYLVWMMFAQRMWGNDGVGGNGNVELNARINELQSQMQDNHNSDLLMSAINGNNTAIHELASNLCVSTRDLQMAICGVQNSITQVAGQVGMTGERVINSVLLGNKDLTSAIQNCCCNTQQSILKMGYEGQLATQAQTNALLERIGLLSTGMTQGFAQVGYATQQQTCDILNAGERNTQRIVDVLNQHWNQDLQLKYQDAKAELSQLAQTNQLSAQLNSLAAAIAKIPTTTTTATA